ncbi:hypothetical protein VC83_05404 [Pseudogymnoascus destructans]|uniref:Uncharacterized protein n=1 Tax=Pseudogymnoascus destructans TaxID=655981 RepID=A0A177A9W5_9PEZI|nr:uncharacterized protein VC83_05404 [Pseudogymnoascus destructans]OAF57973.2 hypothetical protein VC83_05404 [Pseudogymnoascus destructans]
MSNLGDKNKVINAAVDDDEPDEWDKRIFSTGCATENTKMNDCFYEKKDWRQCKEEVCKPQILPFQISKRFRTRVTGTLQLSSAWLIDTLFKARQLQALLEETEQ